MNPRARSGPDALLDDIDNDAWPDRAAHDDDAPAPEPEPPSVITILVAHALIGAVIFFVLLTGAMLVSFVINGRPGVWVAASRWPWMLLISVTAATVAAGSALWRARHLRKSSAR